MINKSLAIGIVILFIVSSTTTMVVGYETKTVIGESSPTLVSDAPMDSAWPMFGHDARHTGRSPYSTAGNTGVEIWRFTAEGMITGGPVIGDDGTIYFGDWSDYFYALYPDGTFKWKYRTGGTISSTPAIGDDGTVYVGTHGWEGGLYAFAPNGVVKWKFYPSDSIYSSPVIAEDGTIYFGTMGHGFYAVNPNGTVKWHYGAKGDIISSPAIGDDGTVYVGSHSGNFYALHANGTLRWEKSLGLIRGSPTIADDGTVYIEAKGDLCALYPNNGTVKWVLDVGSASNSPSLDEDGVLYIGTVAFMFYAIYPNGTIKWTHDFYDEDRCRIWGSSAAISAEGTIYFGNSIDGLHGGYIMAFNPDGTEKWRKLIASDWVYSSPSIAEDGTVYIGSSSTKMIDEGYVDSIGYLHAFGPIDSNEPPGSPSITGTTNGNPRREYYYRFSTIDPDKNPVSFYVDWGDGTITDWSGGGEGNYKMDECASGETVFIKHVYSRRGAYTVKAKARDGFGGESDWGTLEVSMPKNKAISTPLFSILENHPRLFSIIEHLFGL